MLNSLQQEISDFIDRGLDQNLRIAVTGLSRSGKTAFITSFINQLLSINGGEQHALPMFVAAQKQRIVSVQRVSQRDLSAARFNYEGNMQDLQKNPPVWFDSTMSVSETRLAIRFKRHSGLRSLLSEKGTLYVDIFDYPGEWLLDLPLLEQDFQQWSQQLANLDSALHRQLAQSWLEKVQALDLTETANENVLAQLAADYTDYLWQCKEQGLHFIQPGRFVLPGELAGAPALQFFPLLHLTEAQWNKLQKEARADSYFALLNKRYQYYRDRIVKSFYKDYFATFDRQVILADCLTPLNHSQQAFKDMQYALKQLFNSFHYGKRSLLNRLFSPRIDKLMFLATKLDHITLSQAPNLTSLMRELVQEGASQAAFGDVKIEYSAVAAVRSTKYVMVNQNGQRISAIQGVRVGEQQPVTLFPGSVPTRLPKADFWQNHQFEFDQFEPLPLNEGDQIPHLRMDVVLEFLLGEHLQ